MTEARKQIIELIEPYMDKTLSEGCLSYVNDNDNLYIAKQIRGDTDINFIGDIYIIDSIDNTGDTLYKDRYVNVYYNDTTELDYGLVKAKYLQGQILGHYDLSAVLKYINIKTETQYLNPTIFNDKINLFRHNGKDKIPNKPLHLYTKQEEISLLNLLLKLK